MPPKKQISKDQIINKSYEFVRQNGFQSLTARSLAKELDCSTQPIYQSFQDMNELKNVLAEKSIRFMLQYIENYSEGNYSPLLSKILGYVQFASEEKFLFQIIFTSEVLSLEKTRNLVSLNNEIELNMLVYAHGIIMMKAFGALTLDWDQVQEMIIKAYECFQIKQ